MKRNERDKLGVDKPIEALHQEHNYTQRSAPGKTLDKPNPKPEPYHKTLHDGEGYVGNPGKTTDEDASAQDVKQERSADGQLLRQMEQGNHLLERDSEKTAGEDEEPDEQ